MGIQEDIAILDVKVARLKVEYEQYFMRILRREPTKLRSEVERLILFHSNRPINNTACKFKFNALVARYNSYKQYWTRVLRAIEEGTYVRRSEGGGFGRTGPEPAPEPGRGGSMRPTDEARGTRGQGEAGRPEGAKDDSGKTALGVDEDYIKAVCDRYIEARKECHESTRGLSPDKVKKTLMENIQKVEKKFKTRDVDIKVFVKDGHARLSITPRKKGAA